MMFFINRCHNGNPTGSGIVQYITKTLILYVCMYVCMYVPEIQPKQYTIAQKFYGHLNSPFACGVQYQVLFKSGNEKII